MEVELPPNTKYQVRCIKNIEIIHSDLATLAHSGQRIPGTVINAFTATLQDHDDIAANYAILSSYMAPIVEGSKSKGYGTIDKHIQASHRVAIAQSLDGMFEELKKAREMRWKSTARAIAQLISPQELSNLPTRNISELYRMERGSFIIARSTSRFYIGEVLDIYKRGIGNRYGSVESANALSQIWFLSLRVYMPLAWEMAELNETIYEDDNTVECSPTFTALYHRHHLHTHAPISDILYHIGKRAFEVGDGASLRLRKDTEKHWNVLTRPVVKQKLLKVKVSGGKITFAK